MEHQKIMYAGPEELDLSPMNPRKSFDEDSIQELSKSIAVVGILSPIIVRPGGGRFEIICGARRFKAAQLAGIESIPVIIRDLDDDQAMDLMITENLQRQDVSPIEEAEAFKNLMQHRNYTIQDLMNRFAKSEKFIRHRIKLNDLIPELKDQLNKDMISIGHAYEICKLEPKYQQEIFEEEFSEKRRNERWFNMPSISSIKNKIEQRYSLKLENAIFNPSSISYDKKAGACTTCTKNTASNTILFPDALPSGVCMDRACFKHKTDIHFDRELKRIQEDEPNTVIVCEGYLHSDEDKYVKGLRDSGTQVLQLNYDSGYTERREPRLPEEPVVEDYEDIEEYKSDLNDYNESLEEYQKELEEYNGKISSGVYQRAFMVTGSQKGKTILIERFRNTKSSPGETSAEVSILMQITDLRQKDKRNQELSFEKLYLKAKEILNSKNYSELNTDLTQNEYVALYVIMLENASESLRKEILGKESYYIENNKKLPAAQSITPDQVVRLTRSFIQSKLANGSPNYNISESKITLEICKQFFPEEINPIELELDGKYLNRKKKIDERIAELQAQVPEKKETKKGKKTSQPA